MSPHIVTPAEQHNNSRNYVSRHAKRSIVLRGSFSTIRTLPRLLISGSLASAMLFSSFISPVHAAEADTLSKLLTESLISVDETQNDDDALLADGESDGSVEETSDAADISSLEDLSTLEVEGSGITGPDATTTDAETAGNAANSPVASEENVVDSTNAPVVGSDRSAVAEPDDESSAAASSAEEFESESAALKTQMYLSDIDYDKTTSNTKWKTITYDKNLDGNAITLKVEGETVTFFKGISAHAAANVYYDISTYKDTLRHFSAYLGIDAAQKGQGYAELEILGSNDKSSWTSLFKTGALTSANDAKYVDVDVSSYKYLHLKANPLGVNSNDHTVFANAQLTAQKVEKPTFSKATDLDKQIKELIDKNVSPAQTTSKGMAWSNSPSEDSKKLSKLIWQRALVSQAGSQSLALLQQDASYKEAFNYLWDDALRLYNFVGWDNVDQAGSIVTALQAFARIYNKYKTQLAKTDENHFYLRLAFAVAHAFGRPEMVRFWLQPGITPLPEDRFSIYCSLVESKIFDYAGEAFSPGEKATLPNLGDGPIKDPTFQLPDTVTTKNLTAGQKTASGDTKLAPSSNRWRWSTQDFIDLPMPLMKWVVDTRMNNDEIAWLRDYAWTKHSTNKSAMFDAYSYITYTTGYKYDAAKYYEQSKKTEWNNLYTFDKYFSDYGSSTLRLWHVFNEGAVCGGLAKTYANLAEVFGRPSAVTAQPGHAATLTYYWDSATQRYRWQIDNNISGWQGSNNEFDYKLLNWGNNGSGSEWKAASYTPMATDAINDADNLLAANTYVALADSIAATKTADYLNKQETELRHAISKIKYHEKAYRKLVEVYRAKNASSSEWKKLAEDQITAFSAYPLPMENQLALTKSHITNTTESAEVTIKREQALKSGLTATKESSYQPDITQAMAKSLLGGDKSDFATFSFDGANAGTIILDETYRNSSVRVRYSFDGGTTWKDTNEQVIKLTDEELAKITADQDLTVGLVGTSTTYKIDILAPKTIDKKKLAMNDRENWLRGDLTGLEYRVVSGAGATTDFDGASSNGSGSTVRTRRSVHGANGGWQPYTAETRFMGAQTIELRYGATGKHVAGPSVRYTFTADEQTSAKKYLSVNHITLEGYSSQQSATVNHAAANAIDGSPLTAWHTRYNPGPQGDAKFLQFVLDAPRYLSAVEYTPGGANGRARHLQVFVSLDGKEWTLAHEQDLANNASVKTLTFDSVPAKHIKIVATQTWGNSQREQNLYFSGKMLGFFTDDAKKESRSEATISYSRTADGNTTGGAAGGTDNSSVSTTADTSGSGSTDNTLSGDSASGETTDASRKPVVATLELPEGATTTTDKTHTFTENGTFDFTYTNELGEEKTATATVDWIATAPEETEPEEAAEEQPDVAPEVQPEGEVDKPEEEEPSAPVTPVTPATPEPENPAGGSEGDNESEVTPTDPVTDVTPAPSGESESGDTTPVAPAPVEPAPVAPTPVSPEPAPEQPSKPEVTVPTDPETENAGTSEPEPPAVVTPQPEPAQPEPTQPEPVPAPAPAPTPSPAPETDGNTTDPAVDENGSDVTEGDVSEGDTTPDPATGTPETDTVEQPEKTPGSDTDSEVDEGTTPTAPEASEETPVSPDSDSHNKPETDSTVVPEDPNADSSGDNPEVKPDAGVEENPDSTEVAEPSDNADNGEVTDPAVTPGTTPAEQPETDDVKPAVTDSDTEVADTAATDDPADNVAETTNPEEETAGTAMPEVDPNANGTSESETVTPETKPEAQPEAKPEEKPEQPVVTPETTPADDTTDAVADPASDTTNDTAADAATGSSGDAGAASDPDAAATSPDAHTETVTDTSSTANSDDESATEDTTVVDPKVDETTTVTTPEETTTTESGTTEETHTVDASTETADLVADSTRDDKKEADEVSTADVETSTDEVETTTNEVETHTSEAGAAEVEGTHIGEPEVREAEANEPESAASVVSETEDSALEVTTSDDAATESKTDEVNQPSAPSAPSSAPAASAAVITATPAPTRTASPVTSEPLRGPDAQAGNTAGVTPNSTAENNKPAASSETQSDTSNGAVSPEPSANTADKPTATTTTVASDDGDRESKPIAWPPIVTAIVTPLAAALSYFGVKTFKGKGKGKQQ